MKKTFLATLLLIALLTNSALSAQVSKRIYILDEFKEATIHFRNKSVTTAKMNYDAANGELLYLDNDQLMVLQQNAQISYIEIENHTFRQIGGIFMEVIPLDNGNLYVDWKLKAVSKGKKGAYGQVSQSTNADHINVNHWNPTLTDKQTTEVFDIEKKNTYWILKDLEHVKFNSAKSFIKLFPKEQTGKIETFIKEQKIDFSNLAEVVKLVNYISTLD